MAKSDVNDHLLFKEPRPSYAESEGVMATLGEEYGFMVGAVVAILPSSLPLPSCSLLLLDEPTFPEAVSLSSLSLLEESLLPLLLLFEVPPLPESKPLSSWLAGGVGTLTGVVLEISGERHLLLEAVSL